MRIVKPFKIIIFSSLILTAFSCSQNLPEAKYASPSIVFDYKSEESLPESRLSVFIESTSDVRRYETITVKSLESDYVWNTSEIVRFKASDKMFAGYTNFVVPSGELIPSGQYLIKYVNADDESVEIKSSLRYDKNFYKKTGAEIPDFMKKKSGVRSIIIYDESKKILYFGERKDDLSNSRKIWNKYKDAAYFQDVWILRDNSVICVMPVNEVTPDN